MSSSGRKAAGAFKCRSLCFPLPATYGRVREATNLNFQIMEQYTVKFTRKNIERGEKEVVTIQTHETTLADAFKVALMHGADPREETLFKWEEA